MCTESEHGFDIRYEPRAIHIEGGQALVAYLRLPGNQALALSDHILARYDALIGRPLCIDRHSLAIEILMHVVADRIAFAVLRGCQRINRGRKGPISRLMHWVTVHTDILDCGESGVDRDRFLWDILAKVHGIFYRIFGQRGVKP